MKKLIVHRVRRRSRQTECVEEEREAFGNAVGGGAAFFAEGRSQRLVDLPLHGEQCQTKVRMPADSLNS